MQIPNVNFPQLPKIQTDLVQPATTKETGAAEAVSKTGQTFQEMLDTLSATEMNSNNLLQQLAAGEDVDLHQVMIAVEQTDVSFRIALSVRDKLVEAYKEVMRMQI